MGVYGGRRGGGGYVSLLNRVIGKSRGQHVVVLGTAVLYAYLAVFRPSAARDSTVHGLTMFVNLVILVVAALFLASAVGTLRLGVAAATIVVGVILLVLGNALADQPRRSVVAPRSAIVLQSAVARRYLTVHRTVGNPSHPPSRSSRARRT